MELVYLWVDKYKNIKQQGFDFSPRFACEFKAEYEKYTDENSEEKERLKDNCELVINPKEHIENFFGEKGNINVTGIVGENGSGKSSIINIMETIHDFTTELYLKNRKLNFIIIFNILDNFYIFSSYLNISVITNKKYSFETLKPLWENPKEFPDNNQSYFKDIESKSLGRASVKNNTILDDLFSFLTLSSEMPYPNGDREIKIIREKTINYEPSVIADIVIKNSNSDYTFKLTTFMLYPKIIYIKDNTKLKNLLIKELKSMQRNESLLHSCRNRINSINPDNSLEVYMIKKIVERGLCKKFFIKYTSPDNTNYIQEFYEKEPNLEENYNLEEFEKLISQQNFDLQEMSDKTNTLIQKYIKFLNFDFEDNKGRKVSDLSHGEKSIYSQFVSIVDKIKKSTNSLILLDEPDIALHPNWQKKYLSEFIKTVSQLDKKVHLVITSHSPFILSDLPKENVIFLKDGKQVDVDINPFGANIHTLLSHGFFMKDGLMGEFAKGKIEDVINYLNDKESTIKDNEEAQKLLNIIGEPLIKNQLQRMLDSKRLSKVDEIDKIKLDMGNLAKRLEELEK